MSCGCRHLKERKQRKIAAVAVLMGALLVSVFGMTVRQKEMGVAEYITCVMNKEEAMDGRKIALTFDDGPHPY